MASGPITTWQIEGEKVEIVTDFLFLGSKITAESDCSHEIRRHLLLGRKALTNLDSVLKNRDIYSADKDPYSQGYGLPSGHVPLLWEQDCKEGRVPKNWCLRTLVLEKTPESPLDSKEIKPVNLKGNQPWMFSGRTDAEAEAPVNTVTTWCEELTHWERPWSWERLKAGGGEGAEDEMVGWHHRLNGHEFEQTLGNREG